MNAPPNKSHAPCQPWTSQNSWSAPPHKALFNTLPGSQRPSLGSPSVQRMPYQGLHTPSQSCMVGPTTSPSAHHSSLFRNSLSNGITAGFASPAMQSSCHAISFDREKSQLCEAQQLPLLSPHDPYKAMHRQVLPGPASSPSLRGAPIGLPSCGRRRVNADQPQSGGVNMEFAHPHGNVRRHSSTTQKECRWVPPTPCRGEASCLGYGTSLSIWCTRF